MTKYANSEQILKAYELGVRDFENLELDGEVHDFSGSNLAGSRFCGSYIFGNFRDCCLEGADFSNANVKTCDFSGANLSSARFCGSAIDGAFFDRAVLDEASFEGASEHGYVYGAVEMPKRA